MTTLDKIEPNSLIEIYEKIKESKSKQIFISMQFDKESKPRYKAIKEAVTEVNNRHNLEIKLREIRIDEFNQGHSYKIDDQILKLIDDSGLLIADLTSKNIKDANGNVLNDGDSVTVVKDLKVKGASSSIKIGTKVKNIRLVPDAADGHDIECKIDGFGAMKLKSSVVKKA